MTKRIDLVLVTIVFQSYSDMLVSGSAIWGLLLSNPIPGEGFPRENGEFKISGTRSVAEHHLKAMSRKTIDGQMVGNDELSMESSRQYAVQCQTDDICSDRQFCDLHYGICDDIRVEGDLCRRDEQCGNNLICMFGTCEQKPRPGERGSRCSTEDDCDPHLCCAREHGEKICKPKISLDQRCYVPAGGLEYVLNEMCPCDNGLVCKRKDADDSKISANSQNMPTNSKALWNERELMRCVKQLS